MKLALLDVDGTIFDGAVGLRLLRLLMERRLCDLGPAAEVFELLKSYSRGELERGAMVEQTTRRYAAAIAGLSRREVEKIAIEAWERVRVDLFPFVPGLLGDLARRGFTTLIISSSPEEIIAPLAASLGVSEHRASLFALSEGKYTGGVERMPGAPGEKRRILEAYLRDIGTPPEKIFVIGDSLGDLSVLELADYPLVIEPEPALRSIAEARGWTIADRGDVLERIPALFGD